jgi:hypothetical protein
VRKRVPKPRRTEERVAMDSSVTTEREDCSWETWGRMGEKGRAMGE